MMSLKEICKESISKRDHSWEESLLRALGQDPIYLVEEEPFQGPDGFSYMNISSEEGNLVNTKDFTEWSSEAGLGWVLNLKEGRAPDFVLNYGMIWNQQLRGEFVTEVKAADLKQSGDIHIHKIAEGYLPAYVRENIKSFLMANQIEESYVTLVSQGDQSPYELLFYFPSLASQGEEKDKKNLLEAIAWFLPLHYNLAWAHEKNESFHFTSL